ncbi:MAG: DUF4926 domain-containing protein [Gammaproteobacteria bacterium]|nr:MAG: DUF4926 domain-containing protein [Gammaproteobacteria bacterium]RKZ75147.1 MAG: DUF4926 domain-containing protein [Gammaproteobacteria bacterium]
MKLLDVVALLEDLPKLGLSRGQVGTIVEEYEQDVFEVEFSDLEGRAYALETLSTLQLMKLYYQPIAENAYLQSMPGMQPDFQSRIRIFPEFGK